MKLALLAIGCQTELADASLQLEGPQRIRVDHLGPIELPPLSRDGIALEEGVTWTVEDPRVARVDGSELFALEPGETKVTARVGDDTVDWTLVVQPTIVLSFQEAPARVLVDEEVDLSLRGMVGEREVAPEGIRWSSSNPDVATIDADGHVTPVSAGVVYVTATNGASEAMVELTVE